MLGECRGRQALAVTVREGAADCCGNAAASSCGSSNVGGAAACNENFGAGSFWHQ